MESWEALEQAVSICLLLQPVDIILKKEELQLQVCFLFLVCNAQVLNLFFCVSSFLFSLPLFPILNILCIPSFYFKKSILKLFFSHLFSSCFKLPLIFNLCFCFFYNSFINSALTSKSSFPKVFPFFQNAFLVFCYHNCSNVL